MASAPPLPAPPLRLDTYLRARAHLGRREAFDAIAAGEVAVTGLASASEVEPQRLVYPGDEVRYRGRLLEVELPNGYWMLHKPMGVTCTRRGAETPNLGEWLRELPEATVAIGRLDKPTTGLLLLTTDGDLTYLLTHPQHHATKAYRLTVLGAVFAEDPRLTALSDGVELADGLARASAVHVTFCGPHVSSIEVRVHAGRKHMVRRMARAAGFNLLHLHRRSVGPIEVADLAVGSLRALKAAEVAALYACSGGRPSAWAHRVQALKRLAANRREAAAPDARLEAWLARHAVE